MESQKEEMKVNTSKSLGEFNQIFQIDLDALMRQILAAKEEKDIFEEDDDCIEVLISAFTLVKQGLYLGIIESD